MINVLGVDPSDFTCPDPKSGWGVISVNGRKLQAKACGLLEPGRECDDLERIMVKFAVDVVGVEWALEVYQDGPRGKASRIAITRALLRQNLLAGRLLERASSRLENPKPKHGPSARVHGIEAPRWRKVIGVRQSAGETTDAAVKRAIRMHLANWPDTSNAHERDGGGVAIAIGLGAR